MSDIALLWENIGADFAVEDDDLVLDDGLETAVLVSLFTDRRAETGDAIPDGTDDLRGWWGDAVPDLAGDRIGSRLWLLGRSKLVPELAPRAEEYAREALAWLIEDRVAERVDVTAEVVRNVGLLLTVAVVRPGKDTVSFRYNFTWSAQEARRA